MQSRSEQRHETNRERELLSLLFTVSKQLRGGVTLEALLQHIAEATCELVDGADSASVMFLDGPQGELSCQAFAGLPSEEVSRIAFRPGEGIAGWVASKGEALCLNDTLLDPRFKSFSWQSTSLRSLCCVPLLSRSGVIGVLTASSQNPDQFDDSDVELLSYMATVIAKDVENARLYRMAVTDPLTGAYNRQYLCERLPEEIERHQRYRQSLSIVIIDVDLFKQVNDTYGHAAGDAVLCELSRELVKATRDVDAVIRYGGEEFMLILPSTTLDGTRLLAERLQQDIAAKTFIVPGAEVNITISAGVAELAPDDRDAAALIARADARLYQAKAAGRNCVF